MLVKNSDALPAHADDRSIVVTTDKSADLANEPRPSDSPEEIRKLI